VDAGQADVGQGDGGTPDGAGLPQPTCKTKLSGDAPFGNVLRGFASLTDPYGSPTVTSRYLSVDVYFPQGRRPGAPVILANRVGWDPPGVAAQAATLDADLGAAVEWSGMAGNSGMEGVGIAGQLVGPADGIAANVKVNISGPSDDGARIATGQVRLCSSGSVPAPELAAADSYGPRSTIVLLPTTPLDPAAIHVAVSANGAPVPVSVTSTGRAIEVTPTLALPPNQLLLFDTAGTNDVLGRAFVLTAQPTPISTTATVTDLTFATAPPDGAIVCTAGFVANGKLSLNESYGPGPKAGPYEALLALPDPGAATAIGAEISWQQPTWPGGCDFVELAVVGADGAVETYQHGLRADPSPLTTTVKLPASRPLWLSVKVSAPIPVPQTFPLVGCALSLSSLAFQ
jgi:hypothetical protein